MAENLRRSPLAPLSARMHDESRDSVSVTEIPFLAQINLRCGATDPAVRAAARAALDMDLPTQPNTVARAGDRFVLWLGPDEWLVVDRDESRGGILGRLSAGLAPFHRSIVDLSANRTTIGLSGQRARAVLAKGCSLDLHPRAFASGRCAQTLIAKAQVILHQTGDAPSYRLFVRGSFARYVAAWLLDAMREFRNTA